MSRLTRIALYVIAILALLPPLSALAQQPAPALDNPVYLPLVSASSLLPLPPADEASARISLPSGFAIRIYAQNLVGRARFMAFGPDGALYISLMSGGQIARLPDDNHDGLADANQIVASGLNLPHGLEWRAGWLYVAENDKVSRLRDSDGNGSLDQKEILTTNIPSGGGHETRTVHFGPDGKMYVSAGSSCNVCAETDPRRAAILRFNPDGSIPSDNPFANDADPARRPLWAWGLRNSVDFLWTPGGQLWADHNGRDSLGDNLPPEEVVIPVQAGQSHGWPYCYTAAQGLNSPTQPEILDTLSGLALPPGFNCAQAVPALFTDLAHSAPLGMTLGPAAGSAPPNFPAAYRDSLYVAYHGSWNVNDPASYRDCKVQRIVLSGGQPVSAQTFATGWRAPGQICGSANTWGRPADVIFGPEGAMYISDDKGSRVYRVIYTGP